FEFFDKRLVNNCDGRRIRSIPFVEIPPLDECDVHSSEIIRTCLRKVSVPSLSRSRLNRSFDADISAAILATQGQASHQTCRLDAGQYIRLHFQLLKEPCPSCQRRVLFEWQAQIKAYDVLGIITQVLRNELAEAADHQPGSNQEHHR